jgi:DNA-binding transcriptional MerR regulator
MAMTIGQLARSARVNVETIRFYERKGLMPEPARAPSGYRLYDRSDFERLAYIGRAKELGFTLREILDLLESKNSGAVVSMARAKDSLLQEHERRLARARSKLAQLMNVCEDPSSPDCTDLNVVKS